MPSKATSSKERLPAVDAYIQKAQPFATPILEHLRDLVHRACPDTEEKIKWGFPHFDYLGKPMCSMAGFKQHAAFSFWKASLLDDPKGILTTDDAMGHLGKLTKLSDLPSDAVLTRFIKQAMKLNEAGIAVPKAKPKPVTFEMPDELKNALNKNKTAGKVFEAFSPSNKRDYALWIAEAKTEETRSKRLETAIAWISEGKTRHWKYVKK